MAQGAITIFNQFKEDLGDSIHDFIGTPNTIKLAFTSTAVGSLAASDPAPHFGGTGTTDLSSTQVTGGDISAGGKSLSTITWSETSGTVTFNCDDVSVAVNASNPITAKTAIIYNDTDTNKRAIGFMDLTADGTTAVDLTNGATIAFSSGILTY